MAQRASHTGAGLEQLLAAPHISIMIRTNSFLSKYYKTAGFHLHTPMMSLYTVSSPLFYPSLVNWVLWYQDA